MSFQKYDYNVVRTIDVILFRQEYWRPFLWGSVCSTMQLWGSSFWRFSEVLILVSGSARVPGVRLGFWDRSFYWRSKVLSAFHDRGGYQALRQSIFTSWQCSFEYCFTLNSLQDLVVHWRCQETLFKVSANFECARWTGSRSNQCYFNVCTNIFVAIEEWCFAQDVVAFGGVSDLLNSQNHLSQIYMKYFK